MRYFCVASDLNYLPRGLALYASLEAHSDPFHLFWFCWDDATYRYLVDRRPSRITPLYADHLEKDNPELLDIKAERTRVEYYFTCTPLLPLFVLKHYPNVDVITYLDADLFFFSSPATIHREAGASSIAIIEHRFPPDEDRSALFGIFNVGWLSFRRDAAALSCLEWWRARCLEWCYDRCEPGRFTDQKYLDDWPQRFDGVAVIRQKGANLAPWNVANYRIRQVNGCVWVDDDPLVFFHFHDLKQIRPWLYDLNAHGVRFSPAVRRWVYRPYIRELSEQSRGVSSAFAARAIFNSSRLDGGSSHRAHRTTTRGLIRAGLRSARKWARGESIIALKWLAI